MWVRGNRRDYDGWAALGNDGLVLRADVLPLFLRIEDSERGSLPLRGKGGPVHVAELRDPTPPPTPSSRRPGEIGIPRSADLNGPEQDGVDYVQVTQRRGRRWSASHAYLRPAAGRPNLTVVTGAQATRVVLRAGARWASRTCARGAQTRWRARGGEVILAGGTVNSPQLLLLSGIGPADHLRALGIPVAVDLPGVGRNLQDHLAAGFVVGCPRPCTLAGAESAPNLLRFCSFAAGRSPRTWPRRSPSCASRPARRRPIWNCSSRPAPFIDHGLSAPPGHAISVGAVLHQPRSAGSAHAALGRSAAAPRIEPAYLSDPEGRRPAPPRRRG